MTHQHGPVLSVLNQLCSICSVYEQRHFMGRNPDSGVVLTTRLRAGRSGVWIQTRANEFSLLRNSKAGS